MYYFINKVKYCQICICPVWLYFTLLVCAHFCNEIERCQMQKSLKYLVYCDQRKMMSDLNMSYEKTSDFVSFPFFEFTLP